MTLANPIISTAALRRWPFQKRPVPPPGAVIVFQRSNGELVLPKAAMLASDVSLRGLREMHVVNTRTHGSSFQCKVPSRNISLQFDITVGYSWAVVDPVRVVAQQVINAPAACQRHLERLLRPICRRVDEQDEGRLEDELHALPDSIELGEQGLMISELSFEVRSDAEVLELGKEHFTQAGSLGLHQLRVNFFDTIVRGGTLVANILAHDPSKAAQAAEFIDKQLQDDRKVTLEAMRILGAGEHIRYGELDDAVGAVVKRFQNIVAEPASVAQQAIGKAAEANGQIEQAPEAEAS